MIDRRQFLERGLLVAAGGLVGGLVGLGSLLAWRASGRRPPTAEDLAVIRGGLDANPRAIFMYDPDLFYRLKPSFKGLRYKSNQVQQTNTRGFLGKEEVVHDPAAKSVLFLGDSITYGESVDYQFTFVPLMQELAGSEVRLYNASCPSWSSFQEARFFEKYAADVRWNAVAVTFCPNDLATFTLKNRDGAVSMELLDDNLDAAELLLWGARFLHVRRALGSDETTRPLSEELNYYLLAWIPEAWQTYEERTLVPFLSRNRGVPFFFAVFPTYRQLLALLVNGARPEIALYPQRRLADFCRRHGVPFVDCGEGLSKASGDLASLYVDPYHLSEKGHRAVAEQLWAFTRAFVKVIERPPAPAAL